MIDIGSSTQQRNQPTFLNMPLHVANQILEKMEPMDLLRARKVCRGLRTAVDEFGLRFDCINLNLMKNEVKMKLSGIEIIYTTAENGNSNVTHNEQKTIIDETNFVERAAKDFMILSKHARKIEIRNCTEDKRYIFTTFFEFLKSEKCIHVEEIELWWISIDEVLTILPCFDAKKLKHIELIWITSIDRFERIAHLEQWKNTEEFGITFSFSKIASTMIVYLFHFKFFHINCMDEFPAHTAIQIRDDLLRRSTFQSCKIYFDRLKSNPIELAKVFKPDYNGGNEFNIEYSNGNNEFNISNSLKNHNYSITNFVLNVKRL